MSLRFTTLLAVLASSFILSSISYANDGAGSGGGGHFVFASDGSVTIADQYYHNQVIVPTPIGRSLQLAASAKAGDLGAVGLSTIPNTSTKFRYLFNDTLYYFVDVIPQIADCELKVSLPLPSGSTVDLAACTSGKHTFIKTSDWDSAPTSVKLDLLVHERLREITGTNSEATEGKIMTLINASNLIERIHAKESAQKFESLALKETQLLEAARKAVVDLVFQGSTPTQCKLDPYNNVGDHPCYADIVNYGVTPNGGGIMLRKYLSELPDSSYVGVGSILITEGSIGENVRVLNSGVFHNYWLQNNVTLINANIDGLGTVLENSTIKNAFIVGSNGRHTIGFDDVDFEAVGYPEVAGTLDGGSKYALCYLDVANRGKNHHFDIPSDCRPSR